MPQISIVSGIYANDKADYRQSYPVNYYPVVMPTGISNAYLRQVPGVTMFADGAGVERGSIEFNGLLYKVSGPALLRVYSNGVTEVMGNIPGSGPVSMANSIDRVCIVANGDAFYWSEGGGLQQITDADFTRAIDVIYVDGYFLFIDEQFIFNADLSDPLSINPLSYASAEVEGDANVAIVKVRNEPYVCGQETIEVFQNVGGAGFPFQRVAGAMITKGVVGTKAAIEVEDALFFVGAGRNEAPSVYLAGGGQAQKIATDEIEKVIQSYTDTQLAKVVCESYSANGQYFVLIHLPDQSLVYDIYGSKNAGAPLWHIRKSAENGYRPRGFTRVYGRWIVGDSVSNKIGQLDDNVTTEYGDIQLREFTTPVGFADGNGAIIHSAKVFGISGITAVGKNPKMSLSISRNGITWGQERWIESGKRGQFNEIMEWRLLGRAPSQVSMRFRVANDSFYTPARLELTVEPLNA